MNWPSWPWPGHPQRRSQGAIWAPAVAAGGSRWQAVVGGGRLVAQHGTPCAASTYAICNMQYALAFAAWLNVGCRIAAVPDPAGGGSGRLGAWTGSGSEFSDAAGMTLGPTIPWRLADLLSLSLERRGRRRQPIC